MHACIKALHDQTWTAGQTARETDWETKNIKKVNHFNVIVRHVVFLGNAVVCLSPLLYE